MSNGVYQSIKNLVKPKKEKQSKLNPNVFKDLFSKRISEDKIEEAIEVISDWYADIIWEDIEIIKENKDKMYKPYFSEVGMVFRSVDSRFFKFVTDQMSYTLTLNPVYPENIEPSIDNNVNDKFEKWCNTVLLHILKEYSFVFMELEDFDNIETRDELKQSIINKFKVYTTKLNSFHYEGTDIKNKYYYIMSRFKWITYEYIYDSTERRCGLFLTMFESVFDLGLDLVKEYIQETKEKTDNDKIEEQVQEEGYKENDVYNFIINQINNLDKVFDKSKADKIRKKIRKNLK